MIAVGSVDGPAIVPAADHTPLSVESAANRTLPSPITTFTPPVCRLRAARVMFRLLKALDEPTHGARGSVFTHMLDRIRSGVAVLGVPACWYSGPSG